MNRLMRDIALALRSLVRHPTFGVVVVLTLALGIGVNVVVFAIVNGIFLRPYSYPEPERLVRVYERHPEKGYDEVNLSYPAFLDYRDLGAFEGAAALQTERVNLATADEPVQVEAALTTSGLFETFGLRTRLGRPLLPEDDARGARRVVVLGSRLWERAFAADAGIVGRDISIEGLPHTVVGVLETEPVFPDEAELWLPLALDPAAEPRDRHAFTVVARLAPGAGLDAVRDQLGAISARLQSDYPEAHEGWSAYAVSLREARVGEYRELLALLQGAVAFVLLLACANAANLVLQRAVVRDAELNVRKALGARRGDLIRLLLTETAVLAAIGAAAGLAFGSALLRVVLGAIPSEEIPPYLDFRFDWRVFGFVAGLALVTVLLVGVLPAFKVLRRPDTGAIGSLGKSSAGLRHGRLRATLVVSQICLSVVLLVGAVMLAASFSSLQRVDPGFETADRLVFELALPEAAYPEDSQRAAVRQRVHDEIAALPGVRSSAVGSGVPFQRWLYTSLGALEGVAADQTLPVRDLGMQWIDGPFFETLGLRIVQGRGFTPADDAEAPGVVVLSRLLATTLWPEESALGRRLQLQTAGERWLTVVGVAADTRRFGLGEEPWYDAYLPFAQAPTGARSVNYFVHTASDPLAMVGTVRGAVHRVDPNLPLARVTTLESIVRESLWVERFTSLLFALFTGVAFPLAIVGIYGSLAYSVAQRRREIGIRMALGAEQRSITRLVVWRGLRQALLGVSLGLVLSVAAMQLLSGMLYGVSSTDLRVFAGVALAFVAVAAIASLLPARSASRVDPVHALRLL